MKTDLKDVTFMIPVRIDSIIRLENLISVVQYLFRHFNCHIMVLEADAYNNGIIKRLLGQKIEYHFIEDYDSTFYRTKYLNIMTEMSTTPFLAIWDADIIISSSQIIEAIGKLRNEKYDIALPYDGKVLDVPISIRELFIKNCRIGELQKQHAKMDYLYKTEALCGGAIFVNAISYKKAGMENLAFYGWASEDFERYNRWQILGYKIHKAKGVSYHLFHPRGNNSKFSHHKQFMNSEASVFTTRASSAEELRERFK
ncbi:glycosyltransferase family protein [Bacteroides timonensis]|uniref:galactosyltransferase-related protein n=1 Tax=Bacteroides timonensis TaxID=1470345 RepID=UPI0004AEB90D|nr:galactosyltransferase-related protein [Bacteroides timonensis]